MKEQTASRFPGVLAVAILAAVLAAVASAQAPLGRSAVLPTAFWAGFSFVVLALMAAYSLRLQRHAGSLAAANAEMKRTNLIDPLTGLSNRTHLEMYLAEHFASGSRLEGRVGVCHVELEQFRSLIRTLGLRAGDDALRVMAGRLCEVFGDKARIARVGRNEFVVVLANLTGAKELERLANAVVEQLTSPIWIGAHQRRLGVTVGAAICDANVTTPERLLINADIALSDAGRTSAGRFRVYTDAARTEFENRETLLTEIHAGLREDAFLPHFQPQIDAVSGEHIGFEALARWRHPERGVLSPANFLSAAEESGLIDQIGAMVLRKSLQALARWRLIGFDAPQLGLNFSSTELRDPGFLDKLQWDLELVGIVPKQIRIEIIESVLIDRDDDPAARNVEALAAAGYQIDLDDFGTGHAAISNLRKIRVDRLKIDRSFVKNIDTDPNQRKLTDAILYIANTLGLDTIAEGVETEGERRTLIDMGCVSQQGYLHGRPMSEDDCIAWMAERGTRQPPAARVASSSRRSA